MKMVIQCVLVALGGIGLGFYFASRLSYQKPKKDVLINTMKFTEDEFLALTEFLRKEMEKDGWRWCG